MDPDKTLTDITAQKQVPKDSLKNLEDKTIQRNGALHYTSSSLRTFGTFVQKEVEWNGN